MGENMYSLLAEVLWISKCKYTNAVVEKHIHKCFHLFYNKGGKGMINISTEGYSPEKNEIYFFRPGDIMSC